MISLMVLLVSLLALRAAGRFGVGRLVTWRAAGRGALAIMFLFTGSSHFTGMKHDFAAMIPEPLPDGLWVIYLTGVFEIAGAIGLLVPRARRISGLCLVLLLVAMFPANVNAALNGITLGGNEPASLWLRTPMQALYVAMVWWTSVKRDAERHGRPHAPTLGDERPSREVIPS
jgi:uncharacterized membrane protein